MAAQSGYVVVVTFVVSDTHRKAFRDAVIENALLSRTREAGCQVFDVCEGTDGEIFLYEVYDSETAFKDHLATDHFLGFDRLVAPWVEHKRVLIYNRLSAGD